MSTTREAYATMAKCYDNQSNDPKAEESYRKAIELKDDVADWHYRLGKLLYDGGHREEAAGHLDKAIKLSKSDPKSSGWLWNANFLLGEALRISDPKRALEAYREYIKQTNPNNAYRPDAERAIEELEKKVGQ